MTGKTKNKLLKPAVKVAALFIGIAVAAKAKQKPEAGQNTTNILKRISGEENLTLTDQPSESGLRLRSI